MQVKRIAVDPTAGSARRWILLNRPEATGLRRDNQPSSWSDFAHRLITETLGVSSPSSTLLRDTFLSKMRLLNKNTLKLEWFTDEKVPHYIILSHRWRGAETSLQSFEAEKHASSDQQSAGTTKVLRFCQEVLSYNAEYVWVDTVCIDKTSSAELQEAINSMYRWYEQADLCIVYLDDVTVDQAAGSPKLLKEGLLGSEWFTRGWCLQELLSPREQKFLNRDWAPIGKRKKLGGIIEEITGIRQEYFGDSKKIRSALVAERMSWMSSRKTSRVEDMAYCMLGIFDVNITMLYGEGPKAFIRLQREIIQTIDDDSVFVWLAPEESRMEDLGILAPHPACFSICRNRKVEKSVYFYRDPYRMTTRGLEIELFDYPGGRFQDDQELLLNSVLDGERVRIPLDRRVSSDRTTDRWRRKPSEELSTASGRVWAPKTEKELYDEENMKALNTRHSFPDRNPVTMAMHARQEVQNTRIRFKVFIS